MNECIITFLVNLALMQNNIYYVGVLEDIFKCPPKSKSHQSKTDP